MKGEDPIDVDSADEDEEDDPIDEDQLDEYREMVENLGTFPVRCVVLFVSTRPFLAHFVV